MTSASHSAPLFPIRDAATSTTPGRRCAHLVGICGAGMNALASLLLDLGWSVSGSDRSPGEGLLSYFRSRGVHVHAGHDALCLPPRTDLVIYSAAIPPHNPEREAARRRNVPELSYSRMLGELMRARRGIGIAGTHGKSTTAAMVAAVLLASGREPSACIGAELCGLGKSGWAGAGDLFVVESCEYRRSFLDLSPTSAAILSVEPDHFDCFTHFDETREAFRQFAARVAPTGLVVVRGDSVAAVDAARAASARVETFSLAAGFDWRALDVRPTTQGVRFSASYRDEFVADFSLRVPGRHNVLNALAAAALCHQLGVPPAEVAEGLARFEGVRRRFEFKGTWEGITFLDDYAHHPTEVEATLTAARERFGRRRLWCLFQPHQVSRTRALFGEFAASLALADEVLMAPVYAARETADGSAESVARELALAISARGGRARFCGDLDQIKRTLDDEARPGDVVMTMGAGDIDRVHHEFTRRLQRHRAS
jgi:UDP-N-acetylmuramate--alanine ligase